MDKRHFSFFESYYKAFKGLPPKVIGEIILAMGASYFEDEETELKGLSGSVYELIKPVLESSKKKSENGVKGGSKSKANGKQSESKPKANDKQTLSDKDKDKEKEKKIPSESKKRTLSDIVKERNLDPRLEEKILEWLKYKTERREGYKETGLSNLITEIQNNVNKYGLQPVLNCISQSMGSNYAGIIFDLIKKGNGDNRASPPKQGTKFTNFEEHDYDFDDLEKQFARN